MTLQRFLAPGRHVDCQHPAIVAQAGALAADLAPGPDHEAAYVQRCFEFVRDEVRHSGDHRCGPVTCTASDVLRHRSGYCYAKSHLLAALLRAQGVPAGLCYQRLSVGDAATAPCCLHGLNAVWLQGHGWYRLDARGNKPGVVARFTPPVEALAFAVRPPLERDLPEIWAEPLPVVVEVLERCSTWQQVLAELPDVELLAAAGQIG